MLQSTLRHTAIKLRTKSGTPSRASMCRTPSTRRGPPSTHCAVISLSNVLVLFFLLERAQVDAGFFGPSQDQVHVYCNRHSLLCNLPELVHCVKLYTHGTGKVIHHLRPASLEENPVEPFVSGCCSVMCIRIDNSLNPVSYCKGCGSDRGAGSHRTHHAPVKVI